MQYTANSIADQVPIPGVLRLTGWFQKTDAALASQTVSGLVDTTESRVQCAVPDTPNSVCSRFVSVE